MVIIVSWRQKVIGDKRFPKFTHCPFLLGVPNIFNRKITGRPTFAFPLPPLCERSPQSVRGTNSLPLEIPNPLLSLALFWKFQFCPPFSCFILNWGPIEACNTSRESSNLANHVEKEPTTMELWVLRNDTEICIEGRRQWTRLTRPREPIKRTGHDGR